MNTLQKIEMEGVAAIKKAGRGETLTPAEMEVMRIYTSLHGKKSGNAGKRKTTKTGTR